MNSHPTRVLYLHIDPADAHAVKEMLLDRALFALTSATELTDVLAQLASEPFDVMLVDLEQVSNSDALKKIPQAAPALPVIVASPAADEPIAIHATQNGADNYFLRDRTDKHALAWMICHTTERKQLVESIRASEERYQKLVQVSPEAIAIHQRGKFVFLNPAALKLIGAQHPQEIIGKPILDVVAPDYRQAVIQRNHEFVHGNEIPLVEEKFIRLDGSLIDVQVVATPITFQGEPATQVIVHDISEQKKIKESLRESEDRFRTLFEQAPLGYQSLDANGCLIEVNAAWLETLGYTRDQVIGHWFGEFLVPTQVDLFRQRFPQFKASGEAHVDFEMIRSDGTHIDVHFDGRIGHDNEGQFKQTHCILRNITQLKRAENELRESEARFRSLSDSAPIGIFQTDAEGKTTYANPEFETIFGLTRQACIGYEWFNVVNLHPGDRPTVLEKRQSANQTGENFNSEFRFIKARAEIRWVKMHSAALRDENGLSIGRVGTLEDITEQKQRERELLALTQVGTALRVAETRAEMLPMILNQLMDLIHSTGAFFAMRDQTTDDVIIELALGTSESLSGLRVPAGEGIVARVIATGKLYHNELESKNAQPDSVTQEHPVAYAPLIAQGKVIGVIAVSRPEPQYTLDELDMLTAITEISANAINRVILYEQTETRLQQLTALRNIDQAITSSLDLRVTLDVLLDQVISQLSADASGILILKPNSQALEFITGKGFRARSLQKTQTWLGQNYAGQAALDRRTILIHDCRTAKHPPAITPAFMSIIQTEKFIGYCAVPLIAKGQVKGVLEVFQHTPLRQDKEWLAFLEALAGQAAIAIDNASLFDGLQQANIEMMMAYDATIEGWSRALDLRDHETEGHSNRVAEMTLRLAHNFGLTDRDLVQVRRGALLHDIGKMGVPDSILRKPDALDQGELAYMRRHPEFAYQLLSPIEYLRPALDIPLCHHERWDGTGYPRGLKGEDIPLVARIFAVVDVWDALTSDRPYRSAWTREQAREHIRAEAGKHFDPQVVDLFLKFENGV